MVGFYGPNTFISQYLGPKTPFFRVLGPRGYTYVGDCQNYRPFLGLHYNTGPNLGDPKRDHNFDNSPCMYLLPHEAEPWKSFP